MQSVLKENQTRIMRICPKLAMRYGEGYQLESSGSAFCRVVRTTGKDVAEAGMIECRPIRAGHGSHSFIGRRRTIRRI
jgi:hypothetical protein